MTPPSRRVVLGTAAWAVPVAAVASAAPAFAASGALEIIDVPSVIAVGTVIENGKVVVSENYTGDLTFTLPAGFEWVASGAGGALVISSAGTAGTVVVPAFRAVSEQASVVLTAATTSDDAEFPVSVVATYPLIPLGWVNYTEYYNSEIRLDFYVDLPENLTINTIHYNYYSNTTTVGTQLRRSGADGASTAQDSVVEVFGVVQVTRGGSVPNGMKRLWVHTRGDSHHEDAHTSMKWRLRATFTDGTRTGDPVAAPLPVVSPPDNLEGLPTPDAPSAPAPLVAAPAAAASSTLEVDLVNIPYLPRSVDGRGVGINAWDGTAGSGRYPAGGPSNSQTGWGVVLPAAGPVPLNFFYVDATSGGQPLNSGGAYVDDLYYQFVHTDGSMMPAAPARISLGYTRFYGSSQTPGATSGAYLSDAGRHLDGTAAPTGSFKTGYWKLLVWPQSKGAAANSPESALGSWDPATEPGHQIGSVFVF